MLAVDLVPKALVLVGPGHEENVCLIHLGADDGPITDGGTENSVKRQFRCREKIVPLAVGQFPCLLGTAQADPDEPQDGRKTALAFVLVHGWPA